MDMNEPWEIVPGPEWVRRGEFAHVCDLLAARTADHDAVVAERDEAEALLAAADARLAELTAQNERLGRLYDAREAEVSELLREPNRQALNKIRGEVEYAERQGTWTLDVGPIREILDAAPAPKD